MLHMKLFVRINIGGMILYLLKLRSRKNLIKQGQTKVHKVYGRTVLVVHSDRCAVSNSYCSLGGDRTVCVDVEYLLGPDLGHHLQEDLAHQIRGYPAR